MKRWLFRVGEALLTLWLLVTLCFVLMRAAPGGPFDVEREVTPEIRARLEARYHLDEPLPKQYLRYLGQLAQGDLGPSFQYPDYSVNELIGGGLRVSVPLGIAALALAVLVGVPLGLLAEEHAGVLGQPTAAAASTRAQAPRRHAREKPGGEGHAQEEQHPDTQTVTLLRHRLAHPLVVELGGAATGRALHLGAREATLGGGARPLLDGERSPLCAPSSHLLP